MSSNEFSAASTSSGKSAFVSRFAETMGMEYTEARVFLHGMARSGTNATPADGEESDKFDLMLAVNMNAKLRDVHRRPQFRRFKFLLNNNSQKALNLARMWMAEKITFDEMLLSF